MSCLMEPSGKNGRQRDSMVSDKTYLIMWPLVLLYYLYGTQILPKVSRMVVRRVPWTTKHPFLDVEQSILFTLAALSHFGFCILMTAISDASLGQLGFNTFRPMLFIFGLVLGLGEMGLDVLLCYLYIV